jgi:hypothetical protein
MPEEEHTTKIVMTEEKHEHVPVLTSEKVTEKIHIHFETDAEHNAKIELTKKEKNFQSTRDTMEAFIDQLPLVDPEIVKELGKVFIEGTISEKMKFVVHKYNEIKENHPYLVKQSEITPENAGFPPVPCVKPIYWESKFLGFQCIIKSCPIDLPHLSFKDSSGHHVALKVTMPDLCITCVELSKRKNIGVALFGDIKLEQIQAYKEEKSYSAEDKEIAKKLRTNGLKMTPQEAREVFAHLYQNDGEEKWKEKTRASLETGFSRPTIDKLIEAFPEGLK